DGARRHRRRNRLGPWTRRALVCRRDCRSRPAGARRAPPRAARRGHGADGARGRGGRQRGSCCGARGGGRHSLRAGRAPQERAPGRARAAGAAERARWPARALADADRGHTRRPGEHVLARLVAGAERLEGSLAVQVERFETPVRERAEAQAAQTAELGATLRRLGADELELRQRAAQAGERLAAIDVELARTDAERDEAQRRLYAAGAEPAEGENREELVEKLERYERRREQLGQVNPLAKEEYEAE